MEYDFYFNELQKPEACFSSGFCAFGFWLTAELACANKAKALVKQFFSSMAALEASPWKTFIFSGVEFVLTLNDDTVKVCSRDLYDAGFFDDKNAGLALQEDVQEGDFDEPDFATNTDFYDSQLFAQCGLEDFKVAFLAWLDFIGCPLPNLPID